MQTSHLYSLAFSLIQFHYLYFTSLKCGKCAVECRFTTWVSAATPLPILRNMKGNKEIENTFPYIEIHFLFRSTSLARLDGVEQTALIMGVSLSPLAFHKMGYVGCFLFRCIGTITAILYLSTFPLKIWNKLH